MTHQTWLAGLCSLALAGPALAQGGTAPGTSADPHGSPQDTAKVPPKTAPPADEKAGAPTPPPGRTGSFASNQIVGQIKVIDKDSKQLTIDQAGRPQEIKLGDNATVFLEGRLGSVEDLKEGQQVRAAYEEKAGEKTLRWIEVNPSATGRQGSTGTPGAKETGQGANPGAAAGGAAAPDTKHALVGTVRSVDTDKSQVVLDAAGKRWTVEVQRDAAVFVEGRKASLDDLKEGQQVRASLDPTKTTTTAVRLETLPAGPKATPRTPTGAPKDDSGGKTY